MKRNRFTVEQIIRMLQDAAVHPYQKKSIAHVSREPEECEEDLLSLETKVYRGMMLS